MLGPEGQLLPGNEWELTADPSVAVTVEWSKAGPNEMCLLFFEVLPAGGGSQVGELTRPGLQELEPDRHRLTWVARDPELRPLPPGKYRLVANTQGRDGPCGDVGYQGPKRDVQTSLGLFVVPSR